MPDILHILGIAKSQRAPRPGHKYTSREWDGKRWVYEYPNDEKEKNRLQHAHVSDSATVSSDDKKALAEMAAQTELKLPRPQMEWDDDEERWTHPQLEIQRTQSWDPDWRVGTSVDWSSKPTSMTTQNFREGKSAGKIGLDKVLIRVVNPTRGIKVDYRKLDYIPMSVAGEEEVIVGGQYRVQSVEHVDPTGRGGGTLPMYTLEEV